MTKRDSEAIKIKRRYLSFLRTHGVDYKLHDYGSFTIGCAVVTMRTGYIHYSFDATGRLDGGRLSVAFPADDLLRCHNRFVHCNNSFVAKEYLHKGFNLSEIVIVPERPVIDHLDSILSF